MSKCDWGLAMAAATAGRAACTRRQIGAVIVDEYHRIVSTGYNGAPSGFPHCTDGGCPRGKLTYDQVGAETDYSTPGSPGFCPAVHAEVNAGIYAGREARGATMYISDAPCPDCTKYLAGIGIATAIWPGGNMNPLAKLAEMTGVAL